MEKEATTDNQKPLQNVATKKRGPLHLIRVALYMLRRRSAGKSNSVHVDVASKGLWKRLVGAMRPLHHQQIQHHHHSPQPSIEVGSTIPKVLSFHDVLLPPLSPHGSETPSSSSSDDSMNRYASAQNLQELVRSEGCNCDVVIEDGDDDYGDEMIDARAEEFIAHFYEQMRLQRLESVNRYNDMIEKGSRYAKGAR